jgi:putative addiction module killer protein
MVYTALMLEILKSTTFTKWFSGLRDRQARARIDARIARLRQGNHGDAKLLVGTGGVYELRIDYGPGYRVYFAQRGTALAILLCGGDKRSQGADIKRASAMAQEWKE